MAIRRCCSVPPGYWPDGAISRALVHLIFQPAEEGLGGAPAMIADGLFERFPCDAVFALHNAPPLSLGTAAVHAGLRRRRALRSRGAGPRRSCGDPAPHRQPGVGGRQSGAADPDRCRAGGPRQAAWR